MWANMMSEPFWLKVAIVHRMDMVSYFIILLGWRRHGGGWDEEDNSSSPLKFEKQL